MFGKITTVCLLLSAGVWAQSPYIDSLEIEISKKHSDSLQIEILSELAREYMRLSTPKTLGYLEKLLAFTNENESPRGRAHYLRMAANLHSMQGYYLSAVNLAKQAMSIYQSKGDELNVANAMISIGLIYSDQENYDSAIHYHQKAGKIFKKLGNGRRLGVSFSNLAHCFNEKDMYDSAYHYGLEGMKLNSRYRNTVLTRHDTKNLGYTHLFFQQYDSALYYFQRALAIHQAEKEYQFNNTLNESLYGLALAYEAKGNNAKANEYLMKSIVGGRSIEPNKWYKESLLHMAQKLGREGKAAEQNSYLKEYIQAIDLSTTRQRQDQFKFQEIYEKTLREAYQFELLKIEKALQEEVIRTQRQQIAMAAIGLGLAVLLSTVLLLLNRKYNRVNKALKQKEEALQHKTSELKTANETKDKFFSIVAHDLRSPLASLQGFASLLVNHSSELKQEDITRLGEQLETKLSNSVSLTDNLIAWARNQMQNGLGINIQPVVLRMEIENICNSLQEVVKRKSIILKNLVPADVCILADRNHIQFILRNLLTNAIKFTPAGGRVELDSIQELDVHHLTITDSGTGMDAETIRNLFVLKNKASSKPGTEGETGTGLGLVLVHDFVTLNKGIITVTSQEGSGSCFRITLPTAHT